MTGYSVEIKESSKELTPREKIKLKDTSNAIKFDEVVTDEAPFVLTPVGYAVLNIHNEKSKDNKDYSNYVILAEDGNKYVTGSTSFWTSFIDIWNDMQGEEQYSIEVYKMDSKNYKGKKFLTCSII